MAAPAGTESGAGSMANSLASILIYLASWKRRSLRMVARRRSAQLEADAIFYGRQVSGDGRAGVSYRHMKKGIMWRTDLELEQSEKRKGSTLPLRAADTEESGAVEDSGVTDRERRLLPSSTDGASRAVTTSFDGAGGWQSTGRQLIDLPDGRVGWLNGQEYRQPYVLAHWREKNYKFVLRGRTQYKQVPVFAVELTIGNGGPTTIFIDQNNYLVVGITYELPAAREQTAGNGVDGAANVMVEFAEYGPCGGTVYPFAQAQYTNGEKSGEIALSGINIGVPIDDNVFARPDSGSVDHLSRPVTVPFDYSQKEIVIKGRLNGSEELEFLLDTGANETIIDRRVAAEHFLAKQGQYDIAGVTGYVQAQTSILKRLEIGGLILNDVQTRILNLAPQSRHLGKRIAGIIGTNIIGRSAVTIDYSKPSIVFCDLTIRSASR